MTRLMQTGNRIVLIAMLCHEANRAYCMQQGDFSQVPWDQAPENIQESAINGVRFQIETGATAPEQHENWVNVKVADGWVYGETKDPVKKTHPCLVPYDQLPREQRFKDYLFIQTVKLYNDLLLQTQPFAIDINLSSVPGHQPKPTPAYEPTRSSSVPNDEN